MTERYDAIVVGGGHNGLVCAGLLAQKGKTVLLLEANETFGGAAVTGELAEDCRVPVCAHLLYQLQPAVIKALDLNVPRAAENLYTVALGMAGEHVRLRDNIVEGVSAADAAAYQAFRQQMLKFAALLNKQFNRTPPRLGGGQPRDLLRLAGLGLDVRRLGKASMREFLRLLTMNVRDELVERFEQPLLRGAIALDAVLGTHLGPRSPSSILTYLHRLAGGAGRFDLPRGGMGGLTDLLVDAARKAGVTLKSATPVASVIVENGRVAGVQTVAGERFDSLTVVSSADPKTTVFDLVGARHFETRFVSRVRHLRSAGNAAKLHLVLDGLPEVAGLSEADLGGRLLVAPDEDYVERAFNPAKYGEYSAEPVLEVTLPSVHDRTLAPAGKHVLSAVVQYAPCELEGGWTTRARADFLQVILTTLERYLPGIGARIVATELLLPGDIEARFHIRGGHWHHGELAFDQFMFVRPVAGAAQYRLPLDGLFLCGAGAHPGGGVSGAAGRNAAQAIHAGEKKR